MPVRQNRLLQFIINYTTCSTSFKVQMPNLGIPVKWLLEWLYVSVFTILFFRRVLMYRHRYLLFLLHDNRKLLVTLGYAECKSLTFQLYI